jgi:hypothetical protein
MTRARLSGWVAGGSTGAGMRCFRACRDGVALVRARGSALIMAYAAAIACARGQFRAIRRWRRRPPRASRAAACSTR